MSQILEALYDNSVSPAERAADLFMDTKTRVIYFVKSIENRKVKFTTKVKLSLELETRTAEIARARKAANAKLRQKLNETKRPVLRSLIVDELELWYQVKASEGLDDSTLAVVRRAKDRLAEYWGNKFPSELKTDNMPAWYQWYAENYPGQQMFNQVKYLRNFCRFLAEKYVGDTPMIPTVPRITVPNAKADRARRKRKKARVFTAAEQRTLVRTAPAASEIVTAEDIGTAALIMYTMATRIEETLGMAFKREIILDAEIPVYRWTIGQNKTDAEGEAALHKALIPRLQELYLRREAQGTSLLFPQARDPQSPLKPQQIDWDGWRASANLGYHWTAHTFRHTCLTNLFSDPNIPHALIIKLYRVSLKTALEHYIQTTREGLLKMRDAIEVSL